MGSLRITNISHVLLADYIKAGDTVVDATAGNGYDTVFLAEKVGASGRVHAFDIQQRAVDATRKRLDKYQLADRVVLHLASHTDIKHLKEPIQAAVFNLGYLPGSDKQVVTQPESTLDAVASALFLLQPGGLLVIGLYRGHEVGAREAGIVGAYINQLPLEAYVVAKYGYMNMSGASPYMLAIEKRDTTSGQR